MGVDLQWGKVCNITPALHTCSKCSEETYRYLMKVKIGIKIIQLV